MYRLLLTILLCLKTASSAPQTKESVVTYVKIQPVVEDTPTDTTNTRESRIEKLPLTFPANISTTDRKEPDKISPEKVKTEQAQTLSETSESLEQAETNQSETISEPLGTEETNTTDDLAGNKSNLSDSSEKWTVNQSNISESLDQAETNQSETISDPIGTEETNRTDDLFEISPTVNLSEPNTDLSDTVLAETSQSERQARNFDSLETTTIEDITKYEDILDHTLKDGPKIRAPPKFVPKIPKSSYFAKPKVFQSYSANHLDVGRRKFRSRCSCQKIWNCPKLQISVPRCPDEYFLCCF